MKTSSEISNTDSILPSKVADSFSIIESLIVFYILKKLDIISLDFS